MSRPEIVRQLCTGCGLCASVCTRGGLQVVGLVASFVGADECAGCGLCEAVCPSNAISCPFEIILDEA
ncbi:MAG: 4Fe-4S binding protein [Dehalococcoidia bacterium]|nr:4Fe-4S binding protein [Dehalococcoidia bacterium]